MLLLLSAALFNKLPLQGKKSCLLGFRWQYRRKHSFRVITRGQITSDRKVDLAIALDDRPGQLRLVTEIVSQCGANVISVHHNRNDIKMPITGCYLKLELETRDKEQIEEIKAKFEEAGFSVLTNQPCRFLKTKIDYFNKDAFCILQEASLLLWKAYLT